MEITPISHMCLTVEQIIQWCLQLCLEAVDTERQHGKQMHDVIQRRFYLRLCGVHCITVSYLFHVLSDKTGMCDYRKTHYPIHQTAHTEACKIYHTAYTTSLSEDEPTRFEMYRRKHKFNINLENCTFRWFVWYNYITMQGAKNIKKTVIL
jgi:hypothetical protein